jgi:hypothetical protein
VVTLVDRLGKKKTNILLDQFYDENKPLVYGVNEHFLSR